MINKNKIFNRSKLLDLDVVQLIDVYINIVSERIWGFLVLKAPSGTVEM